MLKFAAAHSPTTTAGIDEGIQSLLDGIGAGPGRVARGPLPGDVVRVPYD
ncbi:hypothetical protein [Mycobacterium sp.]|nr:hypothetical protein [Mycobacterium sp.]HTQ16009.1 hypothetical protein [Mycobacterium sp.]